MVFISIQEVLKDIERSRQRMMMLASLSSRTDQEVIEESTKLDDLLNKYHVLTAKKR